MAIGTNTDDPADLFIALYDEIGDEPWNSQDVVPWLRRDGWVSQYSREICSQVVRTGRAPRRLIASVVKEGPRGLFTVLKGLDDALAHADVRSSTARETQGLYEWAIRHFVVGYLNSDPEDGLLLFRLAGAPRPVGLPARADTFGVVRVPREAMALDGVDYARVPREFDLPFEPPWPGRVDGVRVGCVAMVGSYDELDITLRSDDGGRRYRIGPRTEPLRARVRTVLEALDDSGASIGFLPEATLSDELLDVWRQVLSDTPPDWDGTLHWILVGTGPVGGGEPPHNRAVLLMREEGHPILHYDKRHDFTLSPAQIERWKLKGCLGGERAAEDIHRGNCLVVRESSLGRFAILICEDVTRLTDVGAALGHFGVSHVFAPIFSDPVEERTWDSYAGRDVVKHLGASIAVSNSLAVGRASEPVGRLGTCSVVVPPSDADEEWKQIQVQVGSAERPDEVVLLALPPGEIKRFLS